MKIYALTIAFCNAAQFARTIIEYRKYRSFVPDKHIIALGYYPLNCEKNIRDIKILCDSFGDLEIWDPGSNIGCAQTQTAIINQFTEMDAFFNADPDTSCQIKGWDLALKEELENNEDCIVASCWSEQWEQFKNRLEIKDNIGRAIHPLPFNLSLWRCSFFREIGAVPQLGAHWAETEGPTHYQATLRGKYHSYLMNYKEDISGKFMQDRQLLEYKDSHMRTDGPERFPGYFIEYLRYKYPELLKVDTYIEEGTVFQ